jgi:pSer/pThr/pTyr-binding forkhead associated (FHA) protein
MMDVAEVAAAAPNDAVDAFLVVLDGPSTNEIHLFSWSQDELVIGRGDDVHVRFRELSVSRRHAVLRRDARGLVLEDLGSANGTWCNGEHVVWQQVVNDGDRLRFGTVTTMLVHGAI